MRVDILKRYKLPEARYDMFIRKIFQEAIAKANEGKAVHIILKPEN